MKLKWDEDGKRLYEAGVSKAVLFPTRDGEYQAGVPWNGLTEVDENPTGGEPKAFYANNRKYLNLMSNEELEGTIKAYTYPDEFEACDGSASVADGVTIGQQERSPYGLSYVTGLGNDVKNLDYGYKVHIIYGALASPSSKEYGTVNDDPDAREMSWDFTTTPVDVDGYKPTASLVIDSTKVSKTVLANLETILYGSDEAESRIPMPDEVIKLFTTTTDEVSED